MPKNQVCAYGKSKGFRYSLPAWILLFIPVPRWRVLHIWIYYKYSFPWGRHAIFKCENKYQCCGLTDSICTGLPDILFCHGWKLNTGRCTKGVLQKKTFAVIRQLCLLIRQFFRMATLARISFDKRKKTCPISVYYVNGDRLIRIMFHPDKCRDAMGYRCIYAFAWL